MKTSVNLLYESSVIYLNIVEFFFDDPPCCDNILGYEYLIFEE